MGRLFGTDGARGVANSELTCELAMSIGRAAAMVLLEAEHHKPKVVIGKDTRISSDMLEAALVAGLCSVGADVELLGTVPTPAVAYLVNEYRADAGVMISASHNPCEYNGIKLFNGDGYKLSDSLEEQIEAIVLDHSEMPPCPTGGEIGRVHRAEKAVEDYVRHLLTTTDACLDGMKLAIDCANGSSSATAQKLFTALGADCVYLNDQPNGVNINDRCGSTHIERLGEYVKEHGLYAGIAFDGDADRCLAVDETGSVVDGDKIIATMAVAMKKNGTLHHDAAVVTVMSNLGFFRCCEANGIKAISTKVGDRYVLEEMKKHGYSIGGEQSGHIIFLDYATTGDGQLSAIQLLSHCKATGGKFSEIVNVMERFPQVMINVHADSEQKADFSNNAELAKEIEKVNKKFGKDGRVLVRVSGTEPLIRVMAEGRDFEKINEIAAGLADKIQSAIAE